MVSRSEGVVEHFSFLGGKNSPGCFGTRSAGKAVLMRARDREVRTQIAINNKT